MPPQPVALGADQALSTSLAPASRTTDPSSNISRLPLAPLSGLLGPGGEVVPVVSFQTIGELAEPTKQFLPRNGFSRWTLTGSSSAVPSSEAKPFSLIRMFDAGPASSRVALTAVRLFSKKSLISALTRVGAPLSGTIPVSPPRMFCGALDSV